MLFVPHKCMDKMVQAYVNMLVWSQNFTMISDTLCKMDISQSFICHKCCAMRILMNTNTLLVPYIRLFTWVYLILLHMLRQCVAPYMNLARVICTLWKVYMHTWIILVMPAFFYVKRRLITQYLNIRSLTMIGYRIVYRTRVLYD